MWVSHSSSFHKSLHNSSFLPLPQSLPWRCIVYARSFQSGTIPGRTFDSVLRHFWLSQLGGAVSLASRGKRPSAATHPTIPRTPCLSQKGLSQNASNMEAEKPWCEPKQKRTFPRGPREKVNSTLGIGVFLFSCM